MGFFWGFFLSLKEQNIGIMQLRKKAEEIKEAINNVARMSMMVQNKQIILILLGTKCK